MWCANIFCCHGSGCGGLNMCAKFHCHVLLFIHIGLNAVNCTADKESLAMQIITYLWHGVRAYKWKCNQFMHICMCARHILRSIVCHTLFMEHIANF